MSEQHKQEGQERREQFIQELLDSGKKSGDILDARTMKLPVIHNPEAQQRPQPDFDPEATAKFSPIRESEAYPEEPEETDLDAFFSDAAPLDPIEERARQRREPERIDDFLRAPESPEEDDDDLMREMSGGVLMPALKTAIYIISVLLGAVLLALGVWLAADDIFGLTDGDRVVTVTVTESDSVDNVADKLEATGLIKFKTLFKLYCGLTGAENKIDPGIYELNDYYDYMALVNGMIAGSGSRKTVTITIPEGYEAAQILRLLADEGAADYDDLCDTAANHDFGYAFLEGLPTGDISRLEGYLFPDTYEFYVGDDAETVLGKFLRNYDNKLSEDLYDQLDVLNARLGSMGLTQQLTMHDVLTVASMIEKEAATSGERTSIASVIYNRLCDDNFPHLQIDATVQYALGERKAVLTYADLEVDSPYNTYLYEGLPAGPIACPGLSSIKAALYPADTEYYYYALDVDGTHHFSRTRLEHEQFLASMEEEP